MRKSVEQRIRNVLEFNNTKFQNVFKATFNLLYVPGCVGMKQCSSNCLMERCQLAE